MKIQLEGIDLFSDKLKFIARTLNMKDIKSECRVAFKNNRENGSEEDNPKNLELLYDGKYTWVIGKIRGDDVYGVKNEKDSRELGYPSYDYEVRYDAGPKDLAYFEAKDRNYLRRIRGKGDDSGELRKLEPAIWYLRKVEKAQNIDIGNWWSQKLRLSTDTLEALLENAEAKEKGHDKNLAEEKSVREQQVRGQENEQFQPGLSYQGVRHHPSKKDQETIESLQKQLQQEKERSAKLEEQQRSAKLEEQVKQMQQAMQNMLQLQQQNPFGTLPYQFNVNIRGPQTVSTIAPVAPIPRPIFQNNFFQPQRPIEVLKGESAEENLSPLTPRTQRLFSLLRTSSLEQFHKIVSEVPNVNKKNVGKCGDTALISLCRMEKLRETNELPKMQLLLKHGALWTVPNNDGETAQDILKENHPEFLERFKIAPTFGKKH